MSFWTYILLCSDGSYYTGHTDNLEPRIASHQRGEIDGYTKTRRPVVLKWSQDFSERIDALEAERRIKGWSRPKKEALIAGDWERVSRLARNHQAERRASTAPDQVRGRTDLGAGL